MPLHSQIRPALPSDLNAVVDLSLALCRETEGRDLDPDVVRAGVKTMLGDSHWILLVAENDAGTVIGEIMVGGREWYDWADGEFWWITSVYVRPEARRSGVGRALYARVRELAQAARPRVIGLRGCVRQDNTLAHTVLNQLGRQFRGQVVFEERFAAVPQVELNPDNSLPRDVAPEAQTGPSGRCCESIEPAGQSGDRFRESHVPVCRTP